MSNSRDRGLGVAGDNLTHANVIINESAVEGDADASGVSDDESVNLRH